MTHTKNMNQRINRLTFTPVAGGLQVTAPSNPNLAPPGDYMMFIVDDSGVPSEASWIRFVVDVDVTGLVDGWYFEFDGASSSGSNDATLLNGAAVVSDPIRGSVLSCDGVDDLAVAGNTVGASFSWAAWILTSTASASGVEAWEGDGLISSMVAGAGNDFIVSILNNHLAFYSGDTGNTVEGTTDLSDGNWHHIAVSADASVVNIYVDGVLDGSGPGLTALLDANNGIDICGNPESGRHFAGLIDTIEQYDHALSAHEVLQLAALEPSGDPVAVQNIVSPPAPVNTQIDFTATATGDGDLQYRWNFGDGSPEVGPTASPSASHVYTGPGLYSVTLTVTSSTGSSAVENFWQAVHEPTTASRPSRSSSIVYEPRAGDDRIWNVNPDNDSVSVFNSVTHSKVAEIGVGTSPRSLVAAPDGRVWVTNKADATISIIDPVSLNVVQTVTLPHLVAAARDHPRSCRNGDVRGPRGDRAAAQAEPRQRRDACFDTGRTSCPPRIGHG